MSKKNQPTHHLLVTKGTYVKNKFHKRNFFLTEKYNLIDVEGMIGFKNHHFIVSSEIVDSGMDHQWILKL